MDGEGAMEFSATLCHCDMPFAYLFSVRQFAPVLSLCNAKMPQRRQSTVLSPRIRHYGGCSRVCHRFFVTQKVQFGGASRACRRPLRQQFRPSRHTRSRNFILEVARSTLITQAGGTPYFHKIPVMRDIGQEHLPLWVIWYFGNHILQQGISLL